MTITGRSARSRLRRGAVLASIRVVAIVVGAAASLFGVGYFIVAAIGPEVWWFGGGPGGTGGFAVFPLPLRLLNASAILLWSATAAAIAFILSGLARSVRNEVRFERAVSRAAWALAIALGAGSVAAQIVENIARYSALNLTDVADPTHPVDAPILWAVNTSVLVPDFAFLGLSVVLGLLAYIIGSGERVQQDTEGLV